MTIGLDDHQGVTTGSPFARLRCISGLMEHQMERVLRPHGLTVGSCNVLQELGAAPTAVTPSELAARILVPVTTATMTGVLDTLERRGLVARGPHPTDRRRVLVRLTPAGGALLATVQPAIDDLQRAWTAMLPDPDLARLDDALATLQAGLGDAST